jgi:probable rRNA maturation factor
MEPPSTHRINIVVESPVCLDGVLLSEGIATALKSEGVPPSEVTVLLADDARVQALNRDFRHLDQPTDVLTFPSGENADGDLAIAVPYASRQAAKRGVPLETELVYLAIHGALHLCGLDDQTEAEADEMRQRMSRIAISIGLPPDQAWGSLLHEEAV